jgi:hypothetical protein
MCVFFGHGGVRGGGGGEICGGGCSQGEGHITHYSIAEESVEVAEDGVWVGEDLGAEGACLAELSEVLGEPGGVGSCEGETGEEVDGLAAVGGGGDYVGYEDIWGTFDFNIWRWSSASGIDGGTVRDGCQAGDGGDTGWIVYLRDVEKKTWFEMDRSSWAGIACSILRVGYISHALRVWDTQYDNVVLPFCAAIWNLTKRCPERPRFSGQVEFQNVVIWGAASVDGFLELGRQRRVGFSMLPVYGSTWPKDGIESWTAILALEKAQWGWWWSLVIVDWRDSGGRAMLCKGSVNGSDVEAGGEGDRRLLGESLRIKSSEVGGENLLFRHGEDNVK